MEIEIIAFKNTILLDTQLFIIFIFGIITHCVPIHIVHATHVYSFESHACGVPHVVMFERCNTLSNVRSAMYASTGSVSIGRAQSRNGLRMAPSITAEMLVECIVHLHILL